MKVALDWLESAGVVMREAREVTRAVRSTLRSTPSSVDIRLPVLSSADTVLLLRINRTAGSPTVRQLRASDETPLSSLSPTEARQLESVLLENRQTMTLTPGRDIRKSSRQTFSQQTPIFGKTFPKKMRFFKGDLPLPWTMVRECDERKTRP